jgi:predicted CXXCH cytochrome family protein
LHSTRSQYVHRIAFAALREAFSEGQLGVAGAFFVLKNASLLAIMSPFMMRIRSFAMLLNMVWGLITAAALLGFGIAGAYAEDVDCSMCHPDLARKKTVHAAVNMGCPTCHANLNAAQMPHKVTGKVPKGLSTGQPELCYGCHDKGIFIKKSVHKALGMGCTTCHNPHSTDTPKLLVADLPGLCFTCHTKASVMKNSNVHSPVAGGMCTSCHNPHSSDSRKLLLSEMPGLCYTCHDKRAFENTSTHAPIAGGMCGSCHELHSAKLQKLLISRPPELCFACHDKNKFAGMKTVHGPVEKGLCTSCHAPHASSAPKLLRDKTPAVCFQCHSKTHFEGQKFMHAPVAGGSCTDCHAPHQSNQKNLLTSKIPDLCYKCHFEQEFITRISHPPVQAGMCMVCHEPHAADRERLLIAPINAGCLACHPRIAAKSHATSIGSKGHPLESKKLITIHGKKEPLTCAGCHDPHGSTWNKLFRERASTFFELCKNCHAK